MTTKLARLRRMDRRELTWRSRETLRTLAERAASTVRPPRWRRHDLLRALARDERYRAIRDGLQREEWDAAHRSILQAVAAPDPAFPIGPAMREQVRRRILDVFPGRDADAAARADRLIAGQYDLLGYDHLCFGPHGRVDWQLDPVHNRRPPRAFWSKVPFLSPEIGDHKIIWELNRHQHWLTLGRAFWLTGRRQYRDVVLAQLSSWLDDNPPLVGINWASMLELAFRSISWLWALHFFADDGETAWPWAVDMLLALDRQLTHVERHLSYYFSPNTHLLGEALALYIGGRSLPFLAASPRRAETGRQILLDEIARQIAVDGGHCERSTHYHRYTLDFYLLALIVARITGDDAADALRGAVVALAGTARLLADARGCFPHFGDDDGGAAFPIAGRALDDVSDSLDVASRVLGRPDLRVGGPTEEAMWLLAHPAWTQAFETSDAQPAAAYPSSAHLPDTGYCVSRSSRGHHLVLDAGAHGYMNGGHAHADALSLTLTTPDGPLLVDPGTYCYTIDVAARDRMRSSVMHNTLTLDGRSASVPAGPFHWVGRADAHVHRWRTNPRFDYADATHDGYAPVEHRRRVLSLHDDLLVVADLVDGSGTHRADVHWHFAPRWTVRASAAGAEAEHGSRIIRVSVPTGDIERFVGDPETGLGWHSPAYGALEPSATLRISRTAPAPFWIVTVFGLDAWNGLDDAEIVPVWSAAGVLAHSLALKIARARTVDYVAFAEPRDQHAPCVWRVAGIETDAAMLLCRVPRDTAGAPEAALVDGSFARCSRVPIALELPSKRPAFYFTPAQSSTDETVRAHVRDCRIR